MSFVPEKFPENPRMAPEKYGMYAYGALKTEEITQQQQQQHGRLDSKS